MYQLSPLIRRYTAVAFLVAFLGVFAGQCFCAAGGRCVAPIATRPTCCMSGGKCSMKGMRAAHNPKAGGSCQSHTAAFFASLAGPPTVAVAPAAPLWLSQPPVLDFTVARGEAWVREQPVALVPPRQLKPKIPDVRVFIHSLTI